MRWRAMDRLAARHIKPAPGLAREARPPAALAALDDDLAVSGEIRNRPRGDLASSECYPPPLLLPAWPMFLDGTAPSSVHNGHGGDLLAGLAHRQLGLPAAASQPRNGRWPLRSLTLVLPFSMTAHRLLAALPGTRASHCGAARPHLDVLHGSPRGRRASCLLPAEYSAPGRAQGSAISADQPVPRPEIAGELSRPLNTVRTHLPHIYAKLQVRDCPSPCGARGNCGLLASAARASPCVTGSSVIRVTLATGVAGRTHQRRRFRLGPHQGWASPRKPRLGSCDNTSPNMAAVSSDGPPPRLSGGYWYHRSSRQARGHKPVPGLPGPTYARPGRAHRRHAF